MMKRALRTAFVLPLAVAAACSTDDLEDQTPDLIDESVQSNLGGATMTDEAPAFGDATMASAEFNAEDPPVADTSTDRPELAGARHVRIAVAWGYLRPHPEATEWIDWSGSITAENAGVRVLRRLRFEQSDMVVRPRTDLHVVEFESRTRPLADGLLLDVVIDDSLNPGNGPVTLTFASAPFTDTLTIEPGMRMTDVREVDDAGHVVAYHVIRPNAPGCTEGFLRGRWQAVGVVAGHEVGRLMGRWVANDGALRGHLRGVLGERPNGKQVWFAKVIDKDGRFLGVLAGRYADGRFGALYIGKDGAGNVVVKGAVHGIYRDADGDRDGAFMGRYSEMCGEEPTEGTPPEGDEPEVALLDLP